MDLILSSYFLKVKSTFEIDTLSGQSVDSKRLEEEKRKNADAFEPIVELRTLQPQMTLITSQPTRTYWNAYP